MGPTRSPDGSKRPKTDLFGGDCHTQNSSGPPLTLAFCNSITTDAAGKKLAKTPGHEVVDPSANLRSEMALPQSGLRRFMMRLFHYSKIFCAFRRMDTVRDFEIDINEFRAA